MIDIGALQSGNLDVGPLQSSIVVSISVTIIGAGSLIADPYYSPDTNTSQVGIAKTGRAWLGTDLTFPSGYVTSNSATIIVQSNLTANAFKTVYSTANIAGASLFTVAGYDQKTNDGWYQLGALLSGSPVHLVERVQSIEYLDGTNRLKLGAPFNGKREIITTGYRIPSYYHRTDRLDIPSASESLVRFKLWDITSSWTAISGFSATLASKTIRNSTLNSFIRHYETGVRRSPGALQISGFGSDGQTSVAIGTSVIWQGDISLTTFTNVSFHPNKLLIAHIDADGATSVSIIPVVVLSSTLQADGQTVVTIQSPDLQFDGRTSFGITPTVIFGGHVAIDGSTAVAISPLCFYGSPIHSDGTTAVNIIPAQAYATHMTMGGNTAVSILPKQAYAIGLDADGSGSFAIINSTKLLYGDITADGETTFIIAVDVYIPIGVGTAVSFTVIKEHNAQIVSTGVGDLFIAALKGIFQGFRADGHTTFSSSPRANYVGLLQIFTGIHTNVVFSPIRNIAVYINANGSTSVHVTTSQDQFGTVIFDQISQTLVALSSFVQDGDLVSTSSSTASFLAKQFPLGSDYIWGIIANMTDSGSPVFTDSFTASSKTARGIGTGDLGVVKYKYAFGFSRPASNYYNKPLEDGTREEWVRFGFYVDSEIDFITMGDTIGFTAAGISAIAGAGIVGRDKEEYITFSVLTNVHDTQTTFEILANGNPHVDVTQVCYEMLWIPASHSRNTQTCLEVLYLANLATINQLALETLQGNNAYANLVVQQVALELMSSIHATTFATQGCLEMLKGSGDPSVQNTLTVLEILTRNQIFLFSDALIQQAAVETIGSGLPHAVIQNAAVECIGNMAPKAWVNHEAIEAMHNGTRRAIIQHTALEQLRNAAITPVNIGHVAVETLIHPEYDPTVAGLVNNPRFHI